MNHKKRSKLVKVNAAASLYAARTALSHAKALSRLAEPDRTKTGKPGVSARRAIQLARRVSRLHRSFERLCADLGVGSFEVHVERGTPYDRWRVEFS